MRIIDRRFDDRGSSATNRRKFIERNKDYIKEQIDKNIKRSKIKNIGNNRRIKISKTEVDISEPSYYFDHDTGEFELVRSGNKKYNKGDKIPKPSAQDAKGGGGGNGEDEEVDFTFTLSKQEFYNLLFDGMELPNFVKKSLLGSKELQYRRAGYTPVGPFSRLDIKKTYEQAIARKISTKAGGKKPRYLDDTDLRFRAFIKEPKPKLSAVMICILDVSGSMEEHHRFIAKKFFILLYLFLTREYQDIELRFIIHTDKALEVNEEEFFYNKKSGGTLVAPVLRLTKDICDEYDQDKINIYIAQAGDGGIMLTERHEIADEMYDLLPKVQYFTFLETLTLSDALSEHRDSYSPLIGWYNTIAETETRREAIGKLMTATAVDNNHVYIALRELFKRR